MSNENYKVSLAFANGDDHGVESTADTVDANLFDVAALANPPVTKAELVAGSLEFTDALAAMANGGKLATARKDLARQKLVDMLKQLAGFVQMKATKDLPLLLSSGFESVSTNRTRVPLPKPVVLKIITGMSGQAIISAQAVSNTRCWEPQYALIGEDGVPGPLIGAPASTSSRRIVIDGLIPGRLYAVHVRGIGGYDSFDAEGRGLLPLTKVYWPVD